MERGQSRWRATLWANALAFAALFGTGAWYLALGLRAREAEASALVRLPPWPVYSAMAALALGLAGAAAVAWLRRRDPDRRVFRLLPVAAILGLSVHLLLLPPYRPPVASDALAAGQLRALGGAVRLPADGAIPLEGDALAAASPPMVAPYLRHGEPAGPWRHQVVRGCEGPLTAAPPDAQAGTFLWCVSADRRRAWVHAVGTGGADVGEAGFVRESGGVATAIVGRGAQPGEP